MSSSLRSLVAALRPLFAVLACAATIGCVSLPEREKGSFVDESDEALVRIGMTQDEVLAALGRPAQDNRFPTGTTIWTYVVLPVGQQVFFDVDFDGAGRVKGTEVRVPGVS